MNLGNRVVARAKQGQQRVGQSWVPEVLANTDNTRKQKRRAILVVRKVGVVLRKPPKHRTYSSESKDEDGGDVKAGSREGLRKGVVEERQVQRSQPSTGAHKKSCILVGLTRKNHTCKIDCWWEAAI